MAASTSPKPISAKQWLDTAREQEYIKFFDKDKIIVGRKLGSGYYGQVFQATYTTMTVAVKMLKDFEGDKKVDKKTIDEFIRELKFLKSVDMHPNILRSFGVCLAPNAKTYMLVLEYADGGSLREYLSSNFTKLEGPDKLQFAKEIAAGVAFLHAHNILHRDLNSTNILIHKNEIKIADLGLSKRITPEATSSSSSVRGQCQYIDPQCFMVDGYVRSTKSDIYSIGVLFWELTSGKVPLSQYRDTVVIRIIEGVRENRIPGTPIAYINLYSRCWAQNPVDRPEIKEVHEKLGNIEWPPGTIVATNEELEIFPSDVPMGIQTNESDRVSIDGIDFVTETRWNDVEIALLDDVTRILKQGLGSTDFDQVTTLIKNYLISNNRTPETLFRMLSGENDSSENVVNHRYALLIGICHLCEIGTTQNSGKAFEAFQASAANEDSYGEFLLGFCYYTDKFYEQAFELYKKSAGKGNSIGQYSLAECYRLGLGTRQNIEEAKRLYLMAAEGGIVKAREALNDRSWQSI